MPNTNYSEKILDKGSIPKWDVMTFIQGFLEDMVSLADASVPGSSGDILKNKSVIDYHKNLSLGDLTIASGKKLMITFFPNWSDGNSQNPNVDCRNYDNTAQILTTFYLTTFAGETERSTLLDFVDFFETRMFNNDIELQMTMESGNILTCSFSQNRMTQKPIITPEFEKPELQNYITAVFDVLFTINKTN